jgi:hypothetical protein
VHGWIYGLSRTDGCVNSGFTATSADDVEACYRNAHVAAGARRVARAVRDTLRRRQCLNRQPCESVLEILDFPIS